MKQLGYVTSWRAGAGQPIVRMGRFTVLHRCGLFVVPAQRLLHGSNLTILLLLTAEALAAAEAKRNRRAAVRGATNSVLRVNHSRLCRWYRHKRQQCLQWTPGCRRYLLPRTRSAAACDILGKHATSVTSERAVERRWCGVRVISSSTVVVGWASAIDSPS